MTAAERMLLLADACAARMAAILATCADTPDASSLRAEADRLDAMLADPEPEITEPRVEVGCG